MVLAIVDIAGCASAASSDFDEVSGTFDMPAVEPDPGISLADPGDTATTDVPRDVPADGTGDPPDTGVDAEPCALPYRVCEDGACHQCCVNADCDPLGMGRTGITCDPMKHKCIQGTDPCAGMCTGPFPVCAVVGGQPQCVACEVDADCALPYGAACTCKADHTCHDDVLGTACPHPDGMCIAPCSTDADCVPTGAATPICTGQGVCRDPSGACDVLTACCVPGQPCIDLRNFMPDAIVPGTTGTSAPLGRCACTTDADCVTGVEGAAACVAMDFACTNPLLKDALCPGGSLVTGLPERLCIDPAVLIDAALGGRPAVCDDPATMAAYATCSQSSDEASCAAAGGEWWPATYLGYAFCRCPTGQAGCPCGREGQCLAGCMGIDATGKWLESCAAGVAGGRCVVIDGFGGCGCFLAADGTTEMICYD